MPAPRYIARPVAGPVPRPIARRVPVSLHVPLALAILLLAGLALAAPADRASPRAVEITGTLFVIVGDDFAGKRADVMHFVQDRASGQMIRLRFATPPQGAGKSGREVRLRGQLSGNELLLDPGDEAVVSGSGGGPGATVEAQPGVTGQRDTLVMLANFKDAALTCSTSAVRDLMFTDPNNKSVDDLYQATSQGQVSLAGTVVAPVTIDYSGSTSCEFNNWATAIREKVALQGIDLNAYPHHVYVLPPASSCPWVGLGSVGGATTASWVLKCDQADVYAHEVGHNIGMQHASTASNEYGDISDIMGGSGYQLREVNGPHLEQMGWRPAARIQNLSTSGTYDVAPLAMSDAQAVAPQVLRFAKPDTGETYYVSYRTAVGFDAGLYSTYLNRVAVHRYKGDGGTTVLVARLDPGQTYSDAANNISVTHLSRTTSYATVQVQVAGSTASCTRQAPSVALSPPSQSATAGGTVSYTATVVNRDSSACAASTFAVSRTVPSGWSGSVSPASLALAPGASATVTLSVTSAATAAATTYPVSVTANDVAVTGHSGTGSASYVVQTSCTRGNPSVTLAPASQSASAGQGLSYSGTITNTDSSGCTTGTFSLARTVPTGWSSSLSSSSITLAPGASTTVVLGVTSTSSATAGSYGVRLDATHAADSTKKGNGSGTYQVLSSADTTAPSAPTGLSGSYNSKQKRISLSWQASTDNVGVVAYRVYRDGVQLGETSGTSYTDSSVTSGATYTYSVRARDAAGNLSAAASLTITAGKNGGGGGGTKTPRGKTR